MKKQFGFLFLVILMLCLAGCRRSNFAVMVRDDYTVEVIAENAKKDMFGGAAGFDVQEGQKLYVEPSLSKGEINIKINSFNLGADASVEELKDAASGNNAELDINISGTEPSEYDLEPGDYSVYASVLSKADGRILFSVY